MFQLVLAVAAMTPAVEAVSNGPQIVSASSLISWRNSVTGDRVAVQVEVTGGIHVDYVQFIVNGQSRIAYNNQIAQTIYTVNIPFSPGTLPNGATYTIDVSVVPFETTVPSDFAYWTHAQPQTTPPTQSDYYQHIP